MHQLRISQVASLSCLSCPKDPEINSDDLLQLKNMGTQKTIGNQQVKRWSRIPQLRIFVAAQADLGHGNAKKQLCGFVFQGPTDDALEGTIASWLIHPLLKS